jgi:hypothetical protein
MLSAPSVSYPVGHSRFARRLLGVLWVMGSIAALAAHWRLDAVDWRNGLLFLSVLAATAAAWRSFVRRMTIAVLQFDGAGWSTSSAAGTAPAKVAIALDLQVSLLLRLSWPDATSRWVWLDRRAMPERWSALRRAVYSRPAALDAVLAAPSSKTPAGTVHPIA